MYDSKGLNHLRMFTFDWRKQFEFIMYLQHFSVLNFQPIPYDNYSLPYLYMRKIKQILNQSSSLLLLLISLNKSSFVSSINILILNCNNVHI